MRPSAILRAITAALLAFSAASTARADPRPFTVFGSATCPIPAEVEHRLAELAPGRGGGQRATLNASDQGLDLTLYGSDDTELGHRTLPADHPCDELAQIATVVLAAWLAALSPAIGPAERLELPPPAAPPPIAETRSPPPPPAAGWLVQVAAAATGSASVGGVAPGASLDVSFEPRNARWGLHLLGVYDGPRQSSVTDGLLRWQRFEAALGGTYALTNAPFELALGADLALSALHAQGIGFSTDAAATSADPGLDLSARLLFLRGQWRPFVALWAVAWLQQDSALIQNVPMSFVFPQFEVFAGVGISFRTACKVWSRAGTSSPSDDEPCK